MFEYQVSGGEDQDDTTIYVKDGIALTFEFQRKLWWKQSYYILSTVNGFGYDSAEIVQYMEELRKAQ
jgi:hypothetical protein